MKKLKKRYLLAFIFVGVFIFVEIAILQIQFTQQQHDARIINVAGRQRMLSQKISKISAQLLTAPTKQRQSLLQELDEAITILEEFHAALRNGNDDLDIQSNYSPEIFEYYEQLDADFTSMVNAAKQLHQSFSTDSSDLRSSYAFTVLDREATFLKQMDAIVFMHETDAQNHLFITRMSVYLANGFILLALVFLWFVLVTPALRRAKEIDQAKDEFVTLASHQLRTPLTAINWYSELLSSGEAGPITDEQKNFSNSILTSSQRMIRLVNALLNVQQIDLGTFSVTPKSVDIEKLTRDVLKDLEAYINKYQQTIAFDVTEDLPKISADEKSLRMVIENLLTNVAKYSPEKGTIAVSIQKTETEIILRVSDSGMGIPKDQQEKIFTKTFRADNARFSRAHGNGLGLYITHSIVKKSGGSIQFESQQNIGTTFYVTLPIAGSSTKNENTKK